jgi:hypothetical protein
LIEAKELSINASAADTTAYTASLFCALNQELVAVEKSIRFS